MAKQERTSRRWLSLWQASEWLGVNATTLRHWADSGVVHSYRTPGGHRRFAREDLEALVRPSGLAALPGSWEQAALARVQKYLRGPGREVWQGAVGEPAARQFRLLGRRLIAVLRAALEQRRGTAASVEEVHELGKAVAALLHQTGLPLRQALVAYFFFQSTLSATLADVYPSESTEARTRATAELEALLREWLLATMEAYEPERGAEQAKTIGADR